MKQPLTAIMIPVLDEAQKQDIDAMFGDGKKVLVDVKGLLNRKEYEAAGYSYWRL